MTTRRGDLATFHRCGHRCELTNGRRCCGCSDQRPHELGGYLHYVDGRGDMAGAPRWANYCFACINRFSHESSDSERREARDHRWREAVFGDADLLQSNEDEDESEGGPVREMYSLARRENGQSIRKGCGHDCVDYEEWRRCCVCAQSSIQSMNQLPLSSSSATDDNDVQDLCTTCQDFLRQQQQQQYTTNSSSASSSSSSFVHYQHRVLAEPDRTNSEPVLRSCGHNHCLLSPSIPACCSCVDTRPTNMRRLDDDDGGGEEETLDGYRVYVDGRGLTDSGTRYQHYCSGCKRVTEEQRAIEAAARRAREEEFQTRRELEEEADSDTTDSEEEEARREEGTESESGRSGSSSPPRTPVMRPTTNRGVFDPLAGSSPSFGTNRGRRGSWTLQTPSDSNSSSDNSSGSGGSSDSEDNDEDEPPSSRQQPIAQRLDFGNPASHPSATAAAAPSSKPPQPSSSTASLPPTNNHCQICFENPLEALFLPCAHLVSCSICASRIAVGKKKIVRRRYRQMQINPRLGVGEVGSETVVDALRAADSSSHRGLGTAVIGTTGNQGSSSREGDEKEGDDNTIGNEQDKNQGRVTEDMMRRGITGMPKATHKCPICRKGIIGWMRVYWS